MNLTFIGLIFIILSSISCSYHHTFEQIKEFEADKDENALIQVLNNDKDFYIRAQAAQSLGRLKSRKAVDSLIKGLEHKDWTVRFYCADSLGKIKDSRAVGPLKARLNKEVDLNVQNKIKEVLGKL